jgi:hypothetical protein
MAELLFIATTVFVAYVLFVVLADKKVSPEAAKVETPNPHTAEAEKIDASVEEAVVTPAVTESVVIAERKPSRSKATATKKSLTAESLSDTAEIDNLKNPATGEIIRVPANYTFAKRWIKDALVAEGLLDKVYKSNELDDAAQVKIHQALEQLKALDKYKV